MAGSALAWDTSLDHCRRQPLPPRHKAAQKPVKMTTSLAFTQFHVPSFDSRSIDIQGPRGYSHQQSRCIVQEGRSLSIREMPAYALGYFPCVCPCPVQRFGCRLRRWLWRLPSTMREIKSTRESGITSSLICLRSQTNGHPPSRRKRSRRSLRTPYARAACWPAPTKSLPLSDLRGEHEALCGARQRAEGLSA